MPDPINYHPHSRFSLHEKANLFPFKDLIWNKTDGPFIDLKVDYADPTNNYADGTAWLRVEDVIEMAHVLGMATREEIEALRQENAELKARLNELPTKVEGFKDELSRVTGDFLSSLAAPSTVVVADEEATDSPKSFKLTNKYAALYPSAPIGDGFDEGLGGNDSGSSDANEPATESSDESIVSEGPDELSSSDSNDTDKSLAEILGL